MAEFKEAPAGAPMAEKALTWIDNRFPLTKLWNDQWGNYYAPKSFKWWYILACIDKCYLS